MGYKFQLKKQEREKLLREKMKAQLLVMDAPLLQSGGEVGITYTCVISKRQVKAVKIGLTGLLLEERGKVAFWNAVKLGTLCADDTPEILEHLATRDGSPPVILAKVVTAPNEFNTCQLRLL